MKDSDSRIILTHRIKIILKEITLIFIYTQDVSTMLDLIL